MPFGALSKMVNSGTGGVKSLVNYLSGTSKPYELKSASSGFGETNTVIKQSIPYLFELVADGQSTYYVFPRGTEQWKASYTPRAALTFTQGGVYQDAIGLAPPKISISGTFGYAATTRSDGKDGATSQHLLHDMIRGFYLSFADKSDFGDDLKDDWWNDGKTDKTFKKADPKNPPTLRFYDFVTNRHWEVLIDNCEFSRSVQRKHLYMYNINMTGIKRVANNTAAEDLASGKFPPEKDINSVLKTLKDMKKFLRDVKGFLNSIKQLKNVAMEYVRDVNNLIRQVADIINTAGGMIQDAAQIPNQIAREFVSSTTALTNSLTELHNTIVENANPLTAASRGIPQEIIVRSRQAQRSAYMLDLATRNNGVTTSNIPRPGQVSTPEPPTTADLISTDTTQDEITPIASLPITDSTRRSGFAEVTGIAEENSPTDFWPDTSNYIKSSVSESDTIYSIAKKHGADWKQIAILNDLDYPYVQHEYSGSKKVLRAGDSIKIPSESAPPPMIPSQEGATHASMLYGTDELLDEQGLMIASAGDIKTITGLQNLEMQLKHLLQTSKGELSELRHPDYGSLLPSFVGMPLTQVWQERIQLECKLVLKQDARVNSVINGRMNIQNSAMYFEGDIIPIGQTSSVTVAMPIDKQFA